MRVSSVGQIKSRVYLLLFVSGSLAAGFHTRAEILQCRKDRQPLLQTGRRELISYMAYSLWPGSSGKRRVCMRRRPSADYYWLGPLGTFFEDGRRKADGPTPDSICRLIELPIKRARCGLSPSLPNTHRQRVTTLTAQD